MPSPLPVIAIVTPALADANNGNWRTAHRWQSLLDGRYRTIVQNTWPGDTTAAAPDLLFALHALRSAAAARRFREAHPDRPLVVALTGTDLYRDLAHRAEARETLAIADALIVLQQDAIQHVPAEHRRKTHVIYQSAKPLSPAAKPRGRLDCVIAGHLRPEKDPETVFRAATLLTDTPAIHFLHIGASADPALAARAGALSAERRNYHWTGALPHGLARAAIKRAHVLVHPSIMEGGANVIVEAIASGTPVVASRMSGNVGMLGEDYEGYFAPGDADALAAELRRCLANPNHLARLAAACAARATLFLPATERAALVAVVDRLLADA